MNNKKVNLENFNKEIQNKLEDDQWDTLIVQKINATRREHSRRRLQFAIIPGLLITATSLFYLAGGHNPGGTQMARGTHKLPPSEKPSTKNSTAENFKIHIMDVVFSKIQ